MLAQGTAFSFGHLSSSLALWERIQDSHFYCEQVTSDETLLGLFEVLEDLELDHHKVSFQMLQPTW